MALLIISYAVFALIRHLHDSYYPKPIKIALSVLRALALFIFILIFLNVKTTFIHDKQIQPSVAFLWDDSKSMARLDSTFHPADIVRSDAYRKLKKDVKIIHIADMIQPAPVSETKVLKMTLDSDISNNGSLLGYAESSMKYKELVLVSDGRSYLGEALEDINLKHGLKVHVVEVGDIRTDIFPILRSVKIPDYVMSGDSIEVSWVLQNPGNEDISTDLKILRGEKEVFNETVSIPAERLIRSQHVFEPAEEGIMELDWYLENDRKIGSETIRVHPSKIRILCHADPLDRDIAMVSTVLSNSEHFEVYNLDDWKELFPNSKPDLTIQTWDANKSNVLFPEIPAILFYRDNYYESFNEHEIVNMKPYVAFSSDPGLNSTYWSQLPPIQMMDLKYQGIVILKNRMGWPLVLERSDEKQIIINGSGLWRWNLAGFEKDWDGLYEHLFNDMVDYLIKQRSKTYISLDKKIYSGITYQNLPIETQLFNLGSVDQDRSFVRVTLLDSTYEEMRRYEHDLDDQTGSFQLNETGTYHIKADLFSYGEILESDTALVMIESNDLEDNVYQYDRNVLKDLAARHKGIYQRFVNADSLRFQISTEKQWVRETDVFIARSTYWLYALMFLLLCADWILRKRHGGM